VKEIRAVVNSDRGLVCLEHEKHFEVKDICDIFIMTGVAS
jgi:hypothetical protein